MPLLVNSHMDQSNIIAETVSQHSARHERNDVRQLSGIGVTALCIEGIVLDQIFGDVGVEGAEDIFLEVEGVDEALEDLALDRLRCEAWGAVGFCGVGTGMSVVAL